MGYLPRLDIALGKHGRLTWLLVLHAIVMVSMSIIGGILSYSNVPYSDMWPGILGFYLNLSDGHYSALWTQHNEHRILIPRLIFWLNYALFNGDNRFLIICNYAHMAGSGILFWCIIRHLAQKSGWKPLHTWASLLILTSMFLWCQQTNIILGFQCAFFEAQSFPLLALFLLYLSAQKPEKMGLFVTATLLGIASIFTMANGLLALPLMSVYAWQTRMGIRRLLILVVLSCLCWGLYFYDYTPPSEHGSLINTLFNQPFELLCYMVLYLGSPVYNFFLGRSYATTLAFAAGMLMLLLTACCLYRQRRSLFLATWSNALLLYLGYLILTALITGGGRLTFGVRQALTDRYTTPALMAWATLLILWLPWLEMHWPHRKRWIACAAVILAILMTPVQMFALIPQKQRLFEYDLAALALTMQIKDAMQIRLVIPHPEGIYDMAKRASEKRLGVFGSEPLLSVSKHFLDTLSKQPSRSGEGMVNRVDPIEGDPEFIRLMGYAFDPRTRSSPKLLAVKNDRNKIVGFVITGMTRQDLAWLHGSDVMSCGFKGYMLANAVNSPLSLVALDSDWQVSVQLPDAK